jgi:hypothetical protein
MLLARVRRFESSPTPTHPLRAHQSRSKDPPARGETRNKSALTAGPSLTMLAWPARALRTRHLAILRGRDLQATEGRAQILTAGLSHAVRQDCGQHTRVCASVPGPSPPRHIAYAPRRRAPAVRAFLSRPSSPSASERALGPLVAMRSVAMPRREFRSTASQLGMTQSRGPQPGRVSLDPPLIALVVCREPGIWRSRQELLVEFDTWTATKTIK